MQRTSRRAFIDDVIRTNNMNVWAVFFANLVPDDEQAYILARCQSRMWHWGRRLGGIPVSKTHSIPNVIIQDTKSGLKRSPFRLRGGSAWNRRVDNMSNLELMRWRWALMSSCTFMDFQGDTDYGTNKGWLIGLKTSFDTLAQCKQDFGAAARHCQRWARMLHCVRDAARNSSVAEQIAAAVVGLGGAGIAKLQRVTARRRALEARQLAPGGRLAKEAQRTFYRRYVRQLCADLDDQATVPELRALAKKVGLRGYAALRKAALCRRLAYHYAKEFRP